MAGNDNLVLFRVESVDHKHCTLLLRDARRNGRVWLHLAFNWIITGGASHQSGSWVHPEPGQQGLAPPPSRLLLSDYAAQKYICKCIPVVIKRKMFAHNSVIKIDLFNVFWKSPISIILENISFKTSTFFGTIILALQSLAANVRWYL